MRPFEVSLVVCLMLLAIFALRSGGRRLEQTLLFATLVFLGLHLYFEGAHWQMLPAYLALLPAILSTRLAGQRLLINASLMLLLSVAAVTFSVMLPMFTLPKPTGQYAVGTRILFLEDSSRHEPALPDPAARRRLVAQIWYPAELSGNKLARYRSASEADLLSSYESVIRTNSRLDAPVKTTGKPLPVLLFSHGLGGRRTALTYLAEDMASHGYLVVSIDYPYLASRVRWSDGHILRGKRRFLVEDPESSNVATVEAEWNKEVELCSNDQIFVLDTLQKESSNPRSVWYGKIDTNLVGAIGHSFGGSAALYASSADPRIRSAINLDGWTFGGISTRDSDKPIMFIYGDLDSARLDDPSLSHPPANVTDQLTQLDISAIKASLKQYGGYVINITETNHLDFTDKALITGIPILRRRSGLGPIKPAEIHAIVRDYVLAFFNKTLLEKDSPILEPQIKPPFPEVTFQRWLPANNTEALPSKGSGIKHIH